MNGIQNFKPNQTSFGIKPKVVSDAANKAAKGVKKAAANASAKIGSGAKDASEKASKFIADEAAKNINGELPKGLRKVCKFLSDNDGEVQNQVINAIFTTTLAPLMIWKNPFSNKSEKDKAYSALRQPISAAIAVSGGLAATLGVNKAFDKLANEGYISSLDLRMNPNDSYLKAQFNSKLKKATSEEKFNFLKNFAPDEASIKGKPSKETLKACLEKYTETVRASRNEVFETLMKEAPENITIDKGAIFVKGNKIAENISNLTDKKQLDAFLQKFNVKNMKNMVGKSSEEIDAAVKSTIKNIGKDFSNFKKYALPFINIPITVLTCTILNWVYPRFVETFFPSLLKTDKVPETVQQGGNK